MFQIDQRVQQTLGDVTWVGTIVQAYEYFGGPEYSVRWDAQHGVEETHCTGYRDHHLQALVTPYEPTNPEGFTLTSILGYVDGMAEHDAFEVDAAPDYTFTRVTTSDFNGIVRTHRETGVIYSMDRAYLEGLRGIRTWIRALPNA